MVPAAPALTLGAALHPPVSSLQSLTGACSLSQAATSRASKKYRPQRSLRAMVSALGGKLPLAPAGTLGSHCDPAQLAALPGLLLPFALCRALRLTSWPPRRAPATRRSGAGRRRAMVRCRRRERQHFWGRLGGGYWPPGARHNHLTVWSCGVHTCST